MMFRDISQEKISEIEASRDFSSFLLVNEKTILEKLYQSVEEHASRDMVLFLLHADLILGLESADH